MRIITIVAIVIITISVLIKMISLISGKNIPASTRDCLAEQRMINHKTILYRQKIQKSNEMGLVHLYNIQIYNTHTISY